MTTLPRGHAFTHTPGAGPPVAGRVLGVRGTVVEIAFTDCLPPLGTALHCQINGGESITAVVHSHRDRSTVQAIAIDSTRGLRCGSEVSCAGLPPGARFLVGLAALTGAGSFSRRYFLYPRRTFRAGHGAPRRSGGRRRDRISDCGNDR